MDLINALGLLASLGLLGCFRIGLLRIYIRVIRLITPVATNQSTVHERAALASKAYYSMVKLVSIIYRDLLGS